MRKALAPAAYQRWLADEAPVWVPLMKQTAVTVPNLGVFAGGPTAFKKWTKGNRSKMVAKGTQEIAHDAKQVEVMIYSFQIQSL
jgi:hypothetical protein